MLDRLKARKEQSGFTIIEVLIVLAIAGLIMVVVFLAVPNLERSQRDNARKTDADNILSSISSYASNNGGVLPVSCIGTACNTTILQGVNLGYFTAGDITYTNGTTFTAPSSTPTPDQMWIYSGATCASAAKPPSAGDSTRNVAIYYGVEGTPDTQCISD